MTPRLEVGRARQEEYEALGAVLTAGYLSIDPGMRGSYMEQLADVAGRSAQPGRVVLAARLDGRPAGCVTVVLHDALPQERVGPDDALLRMLAVDPTAHRLGVGRALVLGAVEAAREVGRTRMLLYTQPVMAPAHRLYESLGFVRVPSRDWDVPDGGPHLLAYELAPL